MQVLTSVAQVADIMAGVKRVKPLHVVADCRGSGLEECVDRLHDRRAKAAGFDTGKMLLTTDVLPIERLSAGAPRRRSLVCFARAFPTFFCCFRRSDQ
jgi:hypothetical protein